MVVFRCAPSAPIDANRFTVPFYISCLGNMKVSLQICPQEALVLLKRDQALGKARTVTNFSNTRVVLLLCIVSLFLETHKSG